MNSVKPLILNAEPKEYSEKARNILLSFADLHERYVTRSELISCIHNYEALIVRLDHLIDANVLEGAYRLKAIATATTGLNHICLREAKKRNIAVISLKGERAFLDTIYATAEHTFGLLLALIRKIPSAVNHVNDGKWNRDKFKGIELANRSLGIIGFGRLGSKVARYGFAFGMKVLAYDPVVTSGPREVEFLTFEDVLSQADILTLHVSYETETRNLIGSREFKMMKIGSYLVNTSRGELIDESALLDALNNGTIAGAALDVLWGEFGDNPEWTKNSPVVKYSIEHENLIITPHIGGATKDSMEKTEIFIANKLKKFFAEK